MPTLTDDLVHGHLQFYYIKYLWLNGSSDKKFVIHKYNQINFGYIYHPHIIWTFDTNWLFCQMTHLTTNTSFEVSENLFKFYL